MCSVSCIIHQHSSGLAVSRRQLLRRVVPVISAAPASYYTVYNLSLSRHLEYLPLLPPAFFFSFLSLFPSFRSFLFPLFHFYSVPLALSSLFSPVLASDFSYFRFALSILPVASFFQCCPLGQFCVSQSSSYGNGEPRGRTMSHNFDNSTTGASFMRWSLYRNNSYDDIAV